MSVKAKFIIAIFVMAALVPLAAANAGKVGRYGERFCEDPDYHCVNIGSHEEVNVITLDNGDTVSKTKKVRDTWENLWPDERERDIVMKLNRMNIRLRSGHVIAVPNDMDGKTYMDFSPYPEFLDEAPQHEGAPEGVLEGELEDEFPFIAGEGKGEDLEGDPIADLLESEEVEELEAGLGGDKLLIYDPKLLAWGAYENGELVRWGPGVGGKSYCGDVKRACYTKTGHTRIYSKRGRYARSSKYPLDCQGSGCAPVPYYMGFFTGYGFHASNNVPGMHASHGCIRLFFDDAMWLHEEFGYVGMKVIVRPY